MDQIHTYKVMTTDELVHNVKWTILSHIKHMMLSENLNYVWSQNRLNDECFVDSTPSRIQARPTFGVGFLGIERAGAGERMIFVLSYRSVRGNVVTVSDFAQMSDSRTQNVIHDTIIRNFEWQSGHNQLAIFNFRHGTDVPRETGKAMKMELVETTFEMDQETGERANGIDWVYRVTES
jgi:hypothetical protein